MYDYICVICDKKFRSVSKKRKYCSRTCLRVGFTKDPYKKKCITCYKIYETKIKKSKFCSPRCIKYTGPIESLGHRKGRCKWKESTEEEKIKILKEKFNSAVIKRRGCWGWKRKCLSNGYGKIHLYRGKVIGSHRAAWIIYKGTIPNGFYVCHRCDNPPCTNPDHLFLGTPKDNQKDCILKNRRNPKIGSQRKNAKLNEAQVKEIKNLLAEEMSWAKISKLYSVSTSSIQGIAHKKTWKHLN